MCTPAPVKESSTAGPVTPAMFPPGQSRSSKRDERPLGAPSRPPGGIELSADARRSLGLALILVASFMVVLDFSIVNVALPSIQGELGLAASAVQWVITGYAITFGGLLILGGRAADLFGRRRMFVAGLLRTCARVRFTGNTRFFHSGLPKAAREMRTWRPGSQRPVFTTMYRMIHVRSSK